MHIFINVLSSSIARRLDTVLGNFAEFAYCCLKRVKRNLIK